MPRRKQAPERTFQPPESLKKRIEAVAGREDYTGSQFLASAAGEKLAVVLTMDYLRLEAETGRRADFEKYLAAVPDVAPPENDRLDVEKCSDTASLFSDETNRTRPCPPHSDPVRPRRFGGQGVQTLTKTAWSIP